MLEIYFKIQKKAINIDFKQIVHIIRKSKMCRFLKFKGITVKMEFIIEFAATVKDICY